MSQPPITEENQLSLLFKQFQGVAQAVPGYGTTPAIQYNAEIIAKLNSIYSSSVFVEPVPKELEKNIGQMKNDNINYTDTQWTSGGTVWNQSIGKTAVKDVNGNSIPYLYFYKRVYLKSTGNDNSWWLPEQATPSTWSSSTNTLRHMIPWLYNDTNASMFTPIIEYWDPSFGGTGGWRTVGLQNQNSGWIIDYATGMVVFYNERTTLNSTYGFDQSAADSDEKARPRISFVRYEGEFLEEAIANGTIGGNSGVAIVGESDNSGNIVPGSTFDASAILFNENQFDVSNNAGKALITISETAFVSDISRYFFDIPPAPYGGDISKNLTAVAAVNLEWQLPDTYLTAVPLGKSLHYIDGSSDVSNANVKYLPFYKELHIDVIDKSDPSKNPTNQSDWESFGTNNSTTQPFFPPSLISGTFHADGTSGASIDYSFGPGSDYPFTNIVTDQVIQTGKTYQFRIYLTNDASGTVIDPTYGNAVPWNYYYLPEGSGGQIALGSFGPPSAPTGAEIFNNPVTYNAVSVDISNTDSNGADASLNNIGWPIPNTLDLNTRFGGDVDGVPDPSNIAIQMPNIRSQIQDSSAEILGPWGKNGRLLIPDIFTTSDLDASSSNWEWYPETTYTLSNVYMQNDTVDFSNIKEPYPGPDTSCNTGVPTRQHVNAVSNRLLPNPANPLKIEEPGPAPFVAVKTDAYPSWNAAPPATPDTSISDIYFITSTDTLQCEITNFSTFGPFANNSDKNGGSVGKQSVGVNLTSFEMSITDRNSANVVTPETTTSTVGFLNTSVINYIGTQFTCSAEAVDPVPSPSDGYYTDILLKNATIKDITLNTIPDICNNAYVPYEMNIQDICGNDKLFIINGPFSIGRKPLNNIFYNVPTPGVSVSPNMNFHFFGQLLPTLGTVNIPSHTYDIENIDLYWRKSLQLDTTRCVYNNNSSLVNGTDTMLAITVQWNNFTGTTKTVTPSIVIEPSSIWDIPNQNDSKRYSRNVSSNPQFAVYISGDNNVALTPSTIDGSYSLRFGGTNKHLFWDYTWDQNPSGTSPGTSPYEFFSFSSGSPIPTFSDPKWVFLEARGNLTATTVTSQTPQLVHTNRMPIEQLLWADHAFRGADSSNNNPNNPKDPYYDFSNNYYNPTILGRLALLDYSRDKTTGIQIGETFLSGLNGWWDNVNQPTSSTTINDLAKYITFKTWMPPVDKIDSTSTTQGYTLVVRERDGNILSHVGYSASSLGYSSVNDYWVYHVEIPPVSPAQYFPFTGQKVAGSSPIGCYASSISGYKVKNTVPSLGTTPESITNLTIVEISIGLPIKSTANIGSVELTWVAS